MLNICDFILSTYWKRLEVLENAVSCPISLSLVSLFLENSLL